MSGEGLVEVHAIDRQTGNHVCGAPGGMGTDWADPAMEITCDRCANACWLCLHLAAGRGNCTACGCLAHYPRYRPTEGERLRLRDRLGITGGGR